MRRRAEEGQAAVELALCLPLVAALALALPLLAVLALGLLQIALLVRDQVLVTHAAREAAREAAVTADPAAPREAALRGARLDPARLRVGVRRGRGPGARAAVVVWYEAPTQVPLIGALLGDVRLRGAASMRAEG